MHEVSNIFTKEKTISSLEVADMVREVHYKQIYQDCKQRIQDFKHIAYLE